MRIPVELVIFTAWVLTGSLLCVQACSVRDLPSIRQGCLMEIISFLDAMSGTSLEQLCYRFDGYLGCVFDAQSACVEVIYDAMVQGKHELRACSSQHIARIPAVTHWWRRRN